MKQKLILIFMCFSFTLANLAFAEDEPEHVIKYRQSVMKSLSGHLKASKLLVAGQYSEKNQLVHHARSIHQLAIMVKSAFPQGSDFGETDAMETIWENMDDFNQKADDLINKSKAFLKQVEASADPADKFAQMAKTCKGCHKKYKEK